jgi:3-oxoacyl-[acyl-carrier protein] reductase
MYAACKGALESFSINVAREWGIKGIRSNCVLPGFMETDMTTKLTSIQKSKIYNRLSLKRPTTINSVAETVVFLLSEKSSSITGETIRVDSGVL